MNYVVGFFFTADRKKVALIKKTRPEWQAGFLNGVGGKVTEEDKTFAEAMRREFFEESGVDTNLNKWDLVAEYRGNDFTLAVFTYTSESNVAHNFKEASEQVDWYNLNELSSLKTIRNVQWMVPLCLDTEVNLPIQIFGG